jgi:hypothetical protein
VNAPAEHPKHVRIRVQVEFQREYGDTSHIVVPWAEWAARTEAERTDFLDGLYDEHLPDFVAGGAEVVGEEPEPAPELPAMPPAEMIAASAKNARADHVNAILIGLDGWWVPDGEELAAARRQYAAEWDSRNPALAAVIAHVDAARDARREAHRRAKAEQRKAKHAANKEGRST